MTDIASSDHTSKSIRRLTVTVWVLAGITFVNLSISLIALFAPILFDSRVAKLPAESSDIAYSLNYVDDHESFHDLPIEKQIEVSSVIALSKWEEIDGAYGCVISEILKHTPGAKFYYKIGDEYRSGIHSIRENTSYGDGLIMFFTGSPASFRSSTSYSNGRIFAFGDMPLDMLRAMINESMD